MRAVLEKIDAVRALVSYYDALNEQSRIPQESRQEPRLPEEVRKMIRQIFGDAVFCQTLEPKQRAAVNRLRQSYEVSQGSMLENILSFSGKVPSVVSKEFESQEERVYSERLAQMKKDPAFSRFIPEKFKRESPPLTLTEIRECVKETEKARQASLDVCLISMFSKLQEEFEGFEAQTHLTGRTDKEKAQKIREFLKKHPEMCDTVQRLDLKDRDLTDLPPEIALFKKLQFLDVSGNQLVSIPSEITLLIALESLDIADNQISSLPSGIQFLKKLETLSAEGNLLKKLPEGITSLPKLRYLNLCRCHLETLPLGMENLQSLEELGFSGESFKKIPKEVFSLRALTHLYIVNTSIETIPNEISHLQNLEELGVTGNQLTALPIAELGSLPQLRVLKVGGNNLSQEDLDILREHPWIQKENRMRKFRLEGATTAAQNF